jgi:hypothetical protein
MLDADGEHFEKDFPGAADEAAIRNPYAEFGDHRYKLFDRLDCPAVDSRPTVPVYNLQDPLPNAFDNPRPATRQ